MTDSDVLAALRLIARDHLGYSGPIELDTPLVEALRLDSLRLLTLVAEVENHFQIFLDPEDEQGLTTAADLVALVHRRAAA